MNTPVSFPLAELAIQKGFDKECKEYWNLIEYSTEWIVEHRINPDSVDFMYAPTIADVCMWLYEKQGLWIYPLPTDEDMKLWQVRIIKGGPFSESSNTLKIIAHGKISYRSMYSPTEAYERGIEYTLNNLI